jgi:crotonobetainyl-CoA:carnitine CoA-transferase CaiB-like acyl-CoA transferase
MTSPLDGVRVLDLGGELAAYGTRILADLGADVVKVEPAGGDSQRWRPPFAGGVPGLETSLTFAYYNANKRGVQLDWTQPGAQAELGRLAVGCDVVVISPSARQPVPGWDRDGRSLSWVGQDTVICCLTPYGLDGPLRDRRATQLTAYADSGGMWSIGPAEGPPRGIPALPFYDELSAHAAFCIMVALRERPQSGGQVIDLSLHDLLAYRESTAVSYYTIAGRSITSRQRGGAAMPPTGIWDVSDGQVELLIWNPPHWDGFLDIVGRPADLLDPALRQRGERFARAEQLAPRVRELLAPFTVQGFWDLAIAHRVPCAPVSTVLQVTRDPQLASRGFWVEHKRLETGAFRAPGRPLRSSVPLLSYRREAPSLGEHDKELLGGRWAASRASQPWSLPRGPRIGDLKVLSFGTAIAGNVSATTLAELGADVVKIESPDRPDPLRLPGYPGLPRAVDPAGREFSVVFSSYSRSGRTLTLDMKSAAGLETFARLVGQADVLIDNFATGVMDGWGLTPEALAAMNPRLIWVSVSGYGRTGKRAKAMAYGTNINGFMGLTRVWSPHGSQFDYTAVAHVLITIFAALAHRDRTGQGSYTEIAQAEAGGVVLAPLFLEALATGQDVWPAPNEVPGSCLSGVFAAAGQDAWLAVELEDASDWDAAARLVGAPDLVTGENGPPSQEAVVSLKKAIADWARTLTPAQGARQFQAAGLAAAAVQEIADLFADGGLWAHGGLAQLSIPDTDVTTWVTGPFQRMRVPQARVRWPSPHPGQHNDEILRDWLTPGE